MITGNGSPVSIARTAWRSPPAACRPRSRAGCGTRWTSLGRAPHAHWRDRRCRPGGERGESGIARSDAGGEGEQIRTRATLGRRREGGAADARSRLRIQAAADCQGDRGRWAANGRRGRTERGGAASPIRSDTAGRLKAAGSSPFAIYARPGPQSGPRALPLAIRWCPGCPSGPCARCTPSESRLWRAPTHRAGAARDAAD